jgi:hypothetical protein
MSHRNIALAVLVGAAGSALAQTAAPAPTVPGAPGVEPSAEEWKIYREYLDALEDEQVVKLKPEKRFDAIAKNFARYGTSRKELEAAVKKGDAAGRDLPARQQAHLKELLEGSDLKGRLRALSVDDSQAHTVTYVTWRNDAEKMLEQEASLIAATVVEGAPLTLTISMAAEDAGGKRVFEAKIDADKARTIKKPRIAVFWTKYIALFDGVKNAYKGDLVGAAPPAAAAAPAPK